MHSSRLAVLVFLFAGFASVARAQTFGPQAITDAADNGHNTNGNWTAGANLVGNDAGAIEVMGLRWRSVPPAQGSTIVSAEINFIARNLTGTITNVHGTVRGNLGDAPVFQDGVFDPNTGWSSTTASTAFDPATFVADVTVYTINVTSIVQEIVNGTWAANDDMAFAIFDNASTTSNFLRVNAFADGGIYIPTLTIVYKAGGSTRCCGGVLKGFPVQ